MRACGRRRSGRLGALGALRPACLNGLSIHLRTPPAHPAAGRPSGMRRAEPILRSVSGAAGRVYSVGASVTGGVSPPCCHCPPAGTEARPRAEDGGPQACRARPATPCRRPAHGRAGERRNLKAVALFGRWQVKSSQVRSSQVKVAEVARQPAARHVERRMAAAWQHALRSVRGPPGSMLPEQPA